MKGQLGFLWFFSLEGLKVERSLDFSSSLMSNSTFVFLVSEVLPVSFQISVVECGSENIIYISKPEDKMISSTAHR